MNQERESLRSFLEKIKKNTYVLPKNQTVSEYTPLMIKYIGDIDASLRDDLIFETFYHWIIVHEYLSEEALKDLIIVLIDEEHLFYNIGLKESDSVFIRSFSSLVLSVILSYQKKKPFIDIETFLKLKSALVRYCKLECDFRGYVNEKGWAHSAAHVADALNELAQCAESDEVSHVEILEAIEKIIFNSTYHLCYKEDDRLARVVHSIYRREYVEKDAIIQWLSNLAHKCDFRGNQEVYVSSLNFRNLNRSFFFQLLYHGSNVELLNAVSGIESTINSKSY